jgi:murein DD-endopeptidase MepM/ murein hydrolase activator NlpD
MTTALTFGQRRLPLPQLDQLNLGQALMQQVQPFSGAMAANRNAANMMPMQQPQQPMAQPMAQGQGPSFQFQDLNRAFQLDPRNTLSNALLQQGMRGGPVRTPLEGIGRLSQSLVGAMLQKRALDRLEGQETTRQENLTSALQNLNLENNPALAALAQFDPKAALTAGVAQEAALQQIGAKANLGRTTLITDATANSLGLDTSQGQKYQQDAKGALSLVQQGKAPTPLGTSFQALAGQEIQKLFNLGDNRTELQTQTMNVLAEQLKRPRIYTTFDANNNQITVREPGLDILSILSGGQTGQTTTATTDVSQQQDGQTATVDQAQQQDGQQDGPEVLGTKTAKLTSAEATFVGNTASAVRDIQTVIDIMFDGDLYNGEYNKLTSVAATSGAGQALSGDAQILRAALDNLIDLTLRKRTGATANAEEIAAYRQMLFPSFTTRGDTMRDKILRLATDYNTNIDVFSQGRSKDALKGLTRIELPKKKETSETMEVEF